MTNFISTRINNLPEPLRKASPALRSLLNNQGLKLLQSCLPKDLSLFVVGGSVRDTLLGRQVSDLDLACDGEITLFSRIFQNSGLRVIETGLQHNTVTILIPPDSSHIELTSLRSGMTDGDIHQRLVADLKLRDFTINSAAIDPLTEELICPAALPGDITRKLIVTTGNAEDRFKEDPLRIMRALRFACELSYSIEDDSWNTICKLAPLLATTAVERIRSEFEKILTSPAPDRGLEMLLQSGILQRYFPELFAFKKFEQNKFHSDDLFVHTLKVISKTSPNLVLRLAALLHDVGKPTTLTIDPDTGDRHFYRHESVGAEITSSFLEKWRFSHQIQSEVKTLVATHMRPLVSGDSSKRRLLRDTGDLFPLWRELKYADASSCMMEKTQLEHELQQFDNDIARLTAEPLTLTRKHLAINGRNLLNAGIPQGERLGEIIDALLEMVIETPELNDYDTLMAEALKMFGNNH
ncbi:MAG: HDIG domain-containing protein [bacterium]|nr:HDIG domain-containing protein [bacterium]